MEVRVFSAAPFPFIKPRKPQCLASYFVITGITKVSHYRIYACGTAKSDNLSVAREMALLDAKGYLAGVISSAVDAVTSQQTNMSESSATTSTEITKKSETLDIPIRGYKSMESETLTSGGLYNHFLLLEMEIGPAANLMNKVLDHTLELNKNRCPQGFIRYDSGCISK